MEDITKLYKILGVDHDATIDEIRQAYRDLVNVWHPDRFRHNLRLQKKAEEQLKRINEAYEKILSARTAEAPQNCRDEPSAPVRTGNPDAFRHPQDTGASTGQVRQESRSTVFTQDGMQPADRSAINKGIGILALVTLTVILTTIAVMIHQRHTRYHPEIDGYWVLNNQVLLTFNRGTIYYTRNYQVFGIYEFTDDNMVRFSGYDQLRQPGIREMRYSVTYPTQNAMFWYVKVGATYTKLWTFRKINSR
jgi:hypothetical protein